MTRVFWFVLVIYMVTWGGHYTSGDGAIKVAWTRAILERGSSDIDPGPGVVHSPYGIGHTLLALPALELSGLIKTWFGISTESLLYTFIFLVNGAWFLYLVARYLQPHYPEQRVWITILILGFATIWWPYTKLDFSEPLVLTFVFWGFLLVRENRLVPGIILASVAALMRQDAAPLVVILALWYCWREQSLRSLPKMIAAGLPAVVVHFVANYVRFQSLLVGDYQGQTFNNPFLVGVYGILFSAGKSVFLFSPPLLLGFLGFSRFRRTPHGRADGTFFLTVFVAQVLIYSMWWDWSGEDSWGVRFVIPGIMLMSIPLVEVLEHRRLVVGIATLGVGVQLLAVLVSGLDFVNYLHSHDIRRKALYVDGYNRVDIEDMRFNPQYTQIKAHYLLVRSVFGFPPRNGQIRDEATEAQIGTPLESTIPPEEWSRLARLDVIWVRLLERQKSGQPSN